MPSSTAVSDPNEAVRAWFAAEDSAGQEQALQGLVAIASDDDLAWTPRARATSALIEFLHLARTTEDRVALIGHLGRCADQFNAVPSLHAELFAREPAVRRAALHALARLGLPFGGTFVAGWLAEVDLAEQPADVLDAALLALARTGSPVLRHEAPRLWATGRVSGRVLHLALADGVLPVLLDEARQHVAHPEVGPAAALHLAACRVDDLARAIAPLRDSADLLHVHLAERLLAQPAPGPDDHLMEVFSQTGSTAALGRAARALRVHPPGTLAEAFRLLTEDVDPPSPEGRRWMRLGLLTGVGALQDAALELAASGTAQCLRVALNRVCMSSEGLNAQLREWGRHENAHVRAAALRARVNTRGREALDAIRSRAGDRDEGVRLEAVRALQTALRNRRDGDGRARLDHATRRMVEEVLRAALAEDAPRLRAQAAFAVGNIGLTGLADNLRRLLQSDADAGVRRAAATALSELPPPGEVDALTERLAAEPVAAVRFRLVRVLLRTVRGGAVSTASLRAAVRAAAGDEDPQLALLATVLRGAAGEHEAVPELLAQAAGPCQSRAQAALTALEHLAAPDAASELVALTAHPDPDRRLRAARALGRLNGEHVAGALLDLVEREQVLPVRRAAAVALRTCPAPPEALPRLAPQGPDDPLIYELLQARMRAQGGQGADDIDARLALAVPGLDLEALERRVPAALQALRAAEYLSGEGALPAGLDASAPVLYWTKALELWLTWLLAPLWLELRQPAAQEALAASRFRWSVLQSGLPRPFASPPGQDLWRYLLDGLLRSLDGPTSRTPSLRDLAAGLLVSGPLAVELGLRPWRCSLTDAERQELAEHLTELAWRRNPLTHSRAAGPGDAAAARSAALGAVARVARLP